MVIRRTAFHQLVDATFYILGPSSLHKLLKWYKVLSAHQTSNQTQYRSSGIRYNMYEIDSIPHKDCELSHGPGDRSTNCAICMEFKEADEPSVVHSNGVCLQSFWQQCFDERSNSYRSQGLNVTCPSCRAELVQVEQSEDGLVDTGWQVDDENLTISFDLGSFNPEGTEAILIIIETLVDRSQRTFQRFANHKNAGPSQENHDIPSRLAEAAMNRAHLEKISADVIQTLDIDDR